MASVNAGVSQAAGEELARACPGSDSSAQEQQEALLRRAFVYGVFQAVFACEPTAERLDVVLGDLAREELGRALPADSAHDEHLAVIDDARDRLRSDRAGLVEELTRVYTRCLVGPQALVAAPWESVYTSDARLLFQETTLDVRRRYVDWGVIPAEYPHVADDHISLELDFLAKLAARTADAQERGNAAAVTDLVRAQLAFLDDHLLRWIGAFADLLAADGGGLYAAMARLAADFAASDRTRLAMR